ncbi:MAG: hypothetical protein ACFFB0_21690, partial [Promethearchaeota archaeon]
IFANHRWGRIKIWFPENHVSFDSERVSNEYLILRNLWNKAHPLDQPGKDILKSILDLEICNWNLENSIMSICKAIGENIAPTIPIGHLKSITSERWNKLWAYYLALRSWLPSLKSYGYESLQNICDPDKSVKKKIYELLDEHDSLKELYVERFCLLLEFWIGNYYFKKSPQLIAHQAAVNAIEKEILRKNPDNLILKAMKSEGDGRLQPCNHKAFHRYDIIISSIGANKWRAIMPRKGTDGLERAALLDKYLQAIGSWIKDYKKIEEGDGDNLFQKIRTLLGEPDNKKIFLASLLILLLRPQGIAAKLLAEKRI